MKPILTLCLFGLLLPACLFSQNRFDIIIDEIMADPSPPVGLPANEWIELKNVSAAPVNLQSWRIGDASGQSGPMPAITIPPGGFIIVCSSSSLTAMSVFGTAVPVTSFPSLDNDGDQLFLKSPSGKIIHAVSYSSSWYKNELKKEGGWTIEMIDTQNPCTGAANWKASTDTRGGTPGGINSADGVNADNTAPVLFRSYTTDNSTIILVYNEPVDSLSGATLSNYTIDGGLSLTSATTLPPLFNTVLLKTNTALVANTIYNITANNVSDCKGNALSDGSVRTGLSSDPVTDEWIVNEILFNPRPNAWDFVECLNQSNKIFDASKLSLANRNNSGVISSIKRLSETPFLIFPGDHIVVTEDPDNLAVHYLVKNPAMVLPVSSMPSYPDDEGTVVLLNFQGEVTDEVQYKDDWHFKLLTDAEGVSLEKIDPAASSSDKTNWHSAASTAGYATPTYTNSQYRRVDAVLAAITVSPKVFSPDNDGRDDIASIQYQTEGPGFVANSTIYNTAGIAVRQLVRNATMAANGYWNWDGLDDKGNKLPVGTYIIFTEIFNLQGKKQQFKTPVVLARKL